MMPSVRQAAKRIIPNSLLDRWRHREQLKFISEHKRMSREEIECYLKHRYESCIGAKLDFSDPRRFTEKIQWCKINAMTAEKSMLSDKYAVRDWVESKIGSRYLIPLLGVWSNPSEIDFDALPEAFVLKTNNASGTNIIVPRKRDLNQAAAKKQLKRWLEVEFGWIGFEPQYLPISPKIVAEEFVSNLNGSEVNDYKVLCFGGEPCFVWVDIDRHTRHSRVVFDTEWNVQPWNQYHYPEALSVPEKPAALSEMLNLARVLARGYAQVRVDFYIVNGKPLFGEMTFTDGSGFEEIRPDEWDYHLGAMWDLSAERSCDFDWVGGTVSGSTLGRL